MQVISENDVINLENGPQNETEPEMGIGHGQMLQLLKELIGRHKQMLTGIKNLNEEYQSKVSSLNEQQLLLLGQIQLLNSLLPEELRITQ